MTRSEAAPHSVAELQHDKQSRALPGSASGPNKAGGALSGSGALASEIAAEMDARRELQSAAREGDSVPALSTEPTGANLGFGQLNGAEQGIRTPGEEKRQEMQDVRNKEFHQNNSDGQQPDLLKLARTSAAKATHVPTNQTNFQSSGASNPIDTLETAARSQGTESGTNANTGNNSGVAGSEIIRDAGTNVSI